MDFVQVVDILKTAGGYGVAGVFVWLFIDERRYTRKLTSDMLTNSIRGVEVYASVAAALQALKDVIKKGE